MLQWNEFLVLVGVELGGVVLLLQVVRRLRRDKDLEPEFDALFFLRWSFGLAGALQIGMVGLVCALFWTRQSLAVGTTALLGFPGWLVVSGLLQARFNRRYNRFGNFIRRFERLSMAQRADALENMPPELLQLIPGDYRIISHEEHQNER